MARDRITRAGARAPGAEYNPTPWRHTKESSARHSAGQPTLTTRCAKDGGKPDIHRRMSGAGLSRRCTGQTLSDMPAFQPYWGKPAVRNDRGAVETSASFEARYAPLSYPTAGGG